jgi:AraC-like DNA-binding protein
MRYEVWAVAPPEIPPRSVLYHLSPIAVGTPWVESLTSYLARLAEAHSISCGMLLKCLLLPCVPKVQWRCQVEGKRSPTGVATAPYGAYFINGLGVSPGLWVRAVEAMTCCRNMECLTMLKWRHVFSYQGLLRKHRAWCSACFEDWSNSGKPIYEPLAWALRPSSACPTHRQALSQVCPNCHRRMPVLSGTLRVGCCSRCKKCLRAGGRDHSETSPTLRGGPDEDACLWMSRAIGDLLAASLSLGDPPTPTLMRQNIQYCIDKVAGGNLCGFARFAGVSPQGIDDWMDGNTVPQIEAFLKICCRSGIPVLRAVLGDLLVEDFDWDGPRKAMAESGCLTASPSGKASLLVTGVARKGLEGQEVDQDPVSLRVRAKKALQTASLQRTPRSVNSISVALGIRKSAFLWRQFPELCRVIVARRAKLRERQVRRIEAALRSALTGDPPPSVKSLSKRVGFSDSWAYHHFPALCRALGACRSKRKHRELAIIQSELRAALSEEPVPSLAVLCKRVGKSISHLASLFPSLYRRLRKRYAARRAGEVAQRHAAYCMELRRVVSELEAQGIYPSRQRVQSVIAGPGLTSSQLSREIKRIRRGLRLGRP